MEAVLDPGKFSVRYSTYNKAEDSQKAQVRCRSFSLLFNPITAEQRRRNSPNHKQVVLFTESANMYIFF